MVAEIALGTLVAIHLGMALYVSYDSKGGAEGQVPVLAHAVGVPIVAQMGLLVVDALSPEYSVPFWVYLLIMPIGVPLIGWLICKAGDLGEYVAERRQRDR